jgi:hypothetical protein
MSVQQSKAEDSTVTWYMIQAPGQPNASGEYRDEMECRDTIRRSGLVKDMSTVVVTPIWPTHQGKDANVYLTFSQALKAARNLTAVEETVGIPAAQWGNRCHEISLAVLRTGIFGPGRVARGTSARVTSQHSWIVLGRDCFAKDVVIIDPTIWFHMHPEPMIMVTRNYRHHQPHGGSSIWGYGRPQEPTGPVIELAGLDDLSSAAKQFLDLLGPLDWRGWAQLSGGPLLGWPAAEIINAMCETPELKAVPPIDAVGMLTDRNPGGLYW